MRHRPSHARHSWRGWSACSTSDLDVGGVTARYSVDLRDQFCGRLDVYQVKPEEEGWQHGFGRSCDLLCDSLEIRRPRERIVGYQAYLSHESSPVSCQ